MKLCKNVLNSLNNKCKSPELTNEKVVIMKYTKPIIMINEQRSEGIYAASGTAVHAPGCDSKYMNNTYQHSAGGWDVSVKDYYGCIGCPAYRANGCALLVDQAYLEGALSYDTDNGNRMPDWERLGYTPEYIISDSSPAPY